MAQTQLPGCTAKDPSSRWKAVRSLAPSHAIRVSRSGSPMQKRGAKHSAARCRVCEWQTRAGVVLVVYILHHPSVAARQPGLREQSIAPGKLSSCQSNGHLVSPWVFPATPSDRPRDAVSPIARSSPPLLAIPNFSTALLKTPVSPDGLVCSI